MNKLVPITLITGYLGAGKTTLLNYVLKNQEGYKVAVIVNDIGEVNIDESLIAKGGQVTTKDENLVPLQNGCICCTLKVDLMDQIINLVKTNRFDYILIEASGICEPIPIAQTIQMLSGAGYDQGLPTICRLDNVVSVVDAKRLVDEFAGGDNLLKDDIDEDDVENLLVQQIEFCNTIILNKIDDISSSEKNTVRSTILALQPSAKIIETNYGVVKMNQIFDTKLFDFNEAINAPGWVQALQEEEEEPETEEYGIGTFVYRAVRPFDKEKFEDYVLHAFPRNIIRSKGMVWFSNERKKALIFEQAGKQKTLAELGLWIAAAPALERERMLDEQPEIRDSWDPVYGDRLNKIVFIGQKMDREKITKDLDNCLGD